MNPSNKEHAFELRLPVIALTDILPVRKFNENDRKLPRYKSVVASIKEIGLLEPLVVYPQRGSQGKYILLDGHVRMQILNDLGIIEAVCIVSTQDEAYSYNRHVNRLSPIQENGMILRAIKNGVPPERIAAALQVDIKKIKASMNLLNGIHPEVVDMLNVKQITPGALILLKRVNPVRQLEMAELMLSTNTFTVNYVRALVTNTPNNQLLNRENPKQMRGLRPEDIARMENENSVAEQKYKIAKETYSVDVYQLTLIRGYIRRLLKNTKIVKFLTGKHADIMSEFQALAGLEAL